MRECFLGKEEDTQEVVGGYWHTGEEYCSSI